MAVMMVVMMLLHVYTLPDLGRRGLAA